MSINIEQVVERILTGVEDRVIIDVMLRGTDVDLTTDAARSVIRLVSTTTIEHLHALAQDADCTEHLGLIYEALGRTWGEES